MSRASLPSSGWKEQRGGGREIAASAADEGGSGCGGASLEGSPPPESLEVRLAAAAEAAFRAGKHAGAEHLLRQLAAVRVRAATQASIDRATAAARGEDPSAAEPAVSAGVALAPVRLRLAQCLLAQSRVKGAAPRYADAERELELALSALEAAHGADDSAADRCVHLRWQLLAELTEVRYWQPDAPDGGAALAAAAERSTALAYRLYGPQSLPGSGALVRQAEAYMRLARLAEAEPLLLRALEVRISSLGPRHAGLRRVLAPLSGLYLRLGMPVRAGRYERLLHALPSEAERARSARQQRAATDASDAASDGRDAAILELRAALAGMSAVGAEDAARRRGDVPPT